MLSADQPPIDPIYALAAEIAKRQTPAIQRAFSQPGHGVVPLQGQGGNVMGGGMIAPDPGQLAVPDTLNPGFPDQPAVDANAPDQGTGTMMMKTAPPMIPRIPRPRPQLPGDVIPRQDRPGFIGRMLPPGLRNGIVDAMAGLAGSDPSAGGLNTLGQAFSGAQSSKQAREDRKLALTSAADQLAYERGSAADKLAYEQSRDARADTRADRRDTRDDRRMTLEERKAAAEERKAQLEEIHTAAGIKKTQAETNKIEREYAKGGLDLDHMFKLESDLTSFRNSKIRERQGPLTSQGLKPDQMAEIEKEVDAERTRRINAVTGGTDTGGSSEVPKTGTSGGDGTWDSPTTSANPESLPIGHVFIAPPGAKYKGEDVSGQPFERQ